jgi:hypothetical protein
VDMVDLFPSFSPLFFVTFLSLLLHYSSSLLFFRLRFVLLLYERFEILTVWSSDVSPCSLVDTDRVSKETDK